MKENILLDKTLEILDEQGAKAAYNYLLQNHDTVKTNNKSQIYNFLYCLAAVSEKREDSLNWLEEAIITNSYWYRPEVFEDSDLKLLNGEERFEHCKTISEQRYLEAKKKAKTMCTWNRKTSDKLMLALHGNQQNIEMIKPYWEFMGEEGYQVEYMQSCELDSYELYRWEDQGSGVGQLKSVLDMIGWNEYGIRALCGFSAGCNVILKTMLEVEAICDLMILQSPWIPAINVELDDILTALKHKATKILVICGNKDEDCLPLAQTLFEKARDMEIDIESVWIDGLSHDFPDEFQDIVNEYLKKHEIK